ncbi:hypothetical protein ACFE04_015244 [Oxalis oulophora]
MSTLRIHILLCLALLGICSAVTVDYDSRAMIINGERKLIMAGAIHYPRSTSHMWPNLIKMAKEGGLNAIETYVFWDRHEPKRREYAFSGNLDFVKFFKEIQKAGLYGILRIGPYIGAEWNYGGLPLWLHKSGVELRTDNEDFKNEMQIFTTKIVNMAKEGKLFASQGGPIIISQIENEYGNVMGPYGEAGIRYMNWCAQMAVAQNIGVPWIMCQQRNAPQPMINTCNGFYCDSFTPNNTKSPKMFTENWSGWFKTWGAKDPLRTAEDLAYSVASATIKNITTNVDLTAYQNNAGERFCFLSNKGTSNDVTADLGQDGQFLVPAWSVSILSNCTKEVFNTAKVNSQTLVYTTQPHYKGKLKWMWSSEAIKDTLDGKGSFKASTLLDQKETTVDSSDYLWYMTNVNINKTSWKTATLKIGTNGHALHAYFNRKLVGTWFSKQVFAQHLPGGTDYSFLANTTVTLKRGSNIISLLSATVGLANYGTKYDLVPVGLVGGSVQLIIDESTIIDLTSSSWSYKVGLNGEAKQLYNPKSRHGNVWKNTPKKVPTARPLTWYKTTFNSPSGVDPVVVDLHGMGKGQAWVNGNSLGRFWPSMIAPADGCANTCDYRGPYNGNKCRNNCGKPSQRWYHVPRSFLKVKGKNTLVLFEEVGGNPSNVSFQNVVARTICGLANENRTLELSCQGGRVISQILFASYGDPQGTCGAYNKGSYEATESKSIVERLCVGKQSCSISVTESVFGVHESAYAMHKLAVQALCKV